MTKISNIFKADKLPFDRTITMDVLMREHPSVIEAIQKNKLHCVGCLLAAFHDVTDVALEHDINEDLLYADLISAAISAKDNS